VVVSPFVCSTCSCCENTVRLKHMTLLMVQGVVVRTSNENSGIDGSRSKSDPEYGIDSRLSTQLMETAEIVRQMLGQGSKRILLADSTKFGKQGFVKICPLTDIDMIITDKGLPQRGVDEITELGIELVIV
jgi:hypothetical protein